MKKVMLLGLMAIALISCKKEDEVKPTCTPQPSAQYSATDYYLTNPSGRGEADTIRFNFDVVDSYFLTSSLVDTIAEPSNVEVSGAELDIYYKMNASGTRWTEGSGTFGTNELHIYWQTAEGDSTNLITFYSVYSKCKTN